ncbi:MAG: 50S ribosomal protein L10 [Elusimicrobiota bacterium]
MATKTEKEDFVQQLTEKLQGKESIFITEYKGLNIPELNELRDKLRAVRCEYTVIKNTMAMRALDKLGYKEGIETSMSGANAFVVGKGDPAETAKVIIKFAQDHEKLKIKLGLLAGKTINDKQVLALSKLPNRKVLLGTLANVIQGPLLNLAYVLQAPIQNLAYALKAVEGKKQ